MNIQPIKKKMMSSIFPNSVWSKQEQAEVIAVFLQLTVIALFLLVATVILLLFIWITQICHLVLIYTR